MNKQRAHYLQHDGVTDAFQHKEANSGMKVSDELLQLAPPVFWAELVALIKRAYPTALEDSKSINENIRNNVAGVHRWGEIESQFKALCDRYELDAEWRANSTKSSFHVELRIGRFLCTISKTDEPNALPLDAEYRKTLLEATQYRLFEHEQPPSGYVYALITHGSTTDSRFPGFIQVLFPDPDRVIREKVDLLARAADAVRSEASAEVIEDKSKPGLRRVRRAAGEDRAGGEARG